jgi:hypothetical protein
MKKMNFKISTGILMVLLIASSCNDFLDINENPNSPITADVQLVLPQAIVASASIANQFNSYGAHFGGYMANAGGFSGFGNLLSYNLTPGDWNGLWVNTYQDPLEDLKYVIDKTEGIDELSYFNAAAKIMTVVNYQRLVDAFGNIPYTDALRGGEGLTAPTYDDAATVYQALIAKLDEAINVINSAQFPLSLKGPTDARAYDPLFQGDIDSWKRYANTLKLRMFVRTGTFGTIDTGIGFLTTDAIVNPGYEKNRPNPTWNSWGRSTTDALSNSSRIPTSYAFAFYGGTGSKISDTGRGETLFVNFPSTPTNQLGNEVNNPTIIAGQVTWASNETGLAGTGVLKGPGMGRPLMLLAESLFLQAEAQLKGSLPGVAGAYITTYYEAMTASFSYLYQDESGAIVKPVAPIVTNYLTVNAGNRLVEIEAATTDAQRLEAIITQKYIAMNMVTSDEGWNEYRRTGFPLTIPGGGARVDIASNKSTVTSRPDRMPTRVLYPSSEQSFNAQNFVSINFSSDRIFWDPN